MHTFLKKAVKPLKMHKLDTSSVSPFRREMVNLLACSVDPFSTAMFQIDIEPCKQRAKEVRRAGGPRITLTPIIVKLIAHAIAENPVFNRMVFGGSIYQFEDITIGNLSMIPGTDAVSYIMLENPHLKTLDEVQQDLFNGIKEAQDRASVQPHPLASFFTNLCYRFGLYRLIGQKRTFAIGFRQGLLPSISLSIHSYTARSNFTMLKDIVPAINISPRMHVNGPIKKPVLENDILVSREVLELSLTADHRIVDGNNFFAFGQSLEKITSHPDQYFG